MSHLCGNGIIEMLDLLEDIKGIDYNFPDSEGNTPLHFAAQAGHVEVRKIEIISALRSSR